MCLAFEIVRARRAKRKWPAFASMQFRQLLYFSHFTAALVMEDMILPGKNHLKVDLSVPLDRQE